MRAIIKNLKNMIYNNLLEPILHSVSPLKEAAVGSAVGMFVGLTPTVGIQMWIVFMIWLFCKYVMNIRFDLVIGTALVWISNPLTMFFMYYVFLVTGNYLFQLLSIEVIDLTFQAFQTKLAFILSGDEKSSWQIFIDGAIFLLIDLGLPMVIGSFLYAVPFSLLTYKGTTFFLKRYRINRALKEGLDYESWRAKYER
jgi:uncharacterized protein (DUF2062 family)